MSASLSPLTSVLQTLCSGAPDSLIVGRDLARSRQRWQDDTGSLVRTPKLEKSPKDLQEVLERTHIPVEGKLASIKPH